MFHGAGCLLLACDNRLHRIVSGTAGGVLVAGRVGDRRRIELRRAPVYVKRDIGTHFGPEQPPAQEIAAPGFDSNKTAGEFFHVSPGARVRCSTDGRGATRGCHAAETGHAAGAGCTAGLGCAARAGRTTRAGCAAGAGCTTRAGCAAWAGRAAWRDRTAGDSAACHCGGTGGRGVTAGLGHAASGWGCVSSCRDRRATRYIPARARNAG